MPIQCKRNASAVALSFAVPGRYIVARNVATAISATATAARAIFTTLEPCFHIPHIL
jgi:hypothetical protein